MSAIVNAADPVLQVESGDGIPEFLRVQNRKPLTPEQQAKLDEQIVKAKAPIGKDALATIRAEDQPAFDENRLESIAKDIEQVQGTATLRIAALLAEARELFRYRRDEGGFAGWVETRLRISRQTAYNLLHVHERFGEQSVEYFDTFPASILYLLAKPSTPNEARDEVIARAEAGEPVSVADVKATIARSKTAADDDAIANERAAAAERIRALLKHRNELESELESEINAACGDDDNGCDDHHQDGDHEKIADSEKIDRARENLIRAWTEADAEVRRALFDFIGLKAVLDLMTAWHAKLTDLVLGLVASKSRGYVRGRITQFRRQLQRRRQPHIFEAKALERADV
jgi:hypothetical protein